MGISETRFVDRFYKKYKGRVAIGVGFGPGMKEIFPFVMEDDDGKALGIIAMTTQAGECKDSVHIYHLSVFKSQRGHGSEILKTLCHMADQLNVILSVSPIPSPNGETDQINTEQLVIWYRNFGFRGDSLLSRQPITFN